MFLYVLNWLRGFVYLADGLIILFTLGLYEPDLSLKMDVWFTSLLENKMETKDENTRL